MLAMLFQLLRQDRSWIWSFVEAVHYRRAGKRSLERWLKIRDSLGSLVVWFGRLWIAWISWSREAGEFMRKRLMKMVRKKRKISDRRYLYDQCRASK